MLGSTFPFSGMPAANQGHGQANPMASMLDGIWDSPMVTQIAFKPRPATASYMNATTGRIRDGSFTMSDGVHVGYRLFLPPENVEVKAVVYFFHGNSETCTEVADVVDVFHRVGAALLSIDYRGFGWSTGQPSITKICSDADECFAASQRVLHAAGIGGVKRIMWGRSIGASSAVHLASRNPKKVHGMVIDSGLLAIKELPMIPTIAQQMLGQQSQMMLQMVSDPHNTRGKLSAIACPVLVVHGDKDEIVPVAQGVEMHDKCASQSKVIKRWPDAGHNNIQELHGKEWATEVAALIGRAVKYTNKFPAGALVEAHSLNTKHLNDLRGRVQGPAGDRIRVLLPDPHGEKALKPENLKLIDEGDSFDPGILVETHSLSAVEMNGMRGTVVAWQNDRVLVSFPHHGEKAIKPTNLKVVEQTNNDDVSAK
eukprot:gnl/TRDRNA2_/TRDRNA2_30968_c0_seq1.p1 gnl/TRDRNA2_/TRDRNA2_30968_c0~~gnl/TRDRNA2_/TRDRNA2_30968_c0_seq1.p1  ORF type:complete len:426 (-),score=75.93 gnl/TRDRNA2_/TRDRNA2_30968_c0_seq1:66-1343(-)